MLISSSIILIINIEAIKRIIENPKNKYEDNINSILFPTIKLSMKNSLFLYSNGNKRKLV